MNLFMEQLVLKRDKSNPFLRNSTIIQWDRASYHKAKGIYEMLERLRIPIMMQGPYSYDIAPCELFFAAFKNDDINPRMVPLGKSHFDEVLKLVVKRCQEIPKVHLILNWHHCLLYVFRYLTFYQI